MYEQFEGKLLNLVLDGLEDTVFEQTNLNYRYVAFVDWERLNTIIFTPKTSKCNIQTIVEKTDEIAFEYLLDVLDLSENVVVEWYQDSEDSMSGYTIYHDVNLSSEEINSYLKIKKKIDDIASDSIGEIKEGYNEVFDNVIINLSEDFESVEDFMKIELDNDENVDLILPPIDDEIKKESVEDSEGEDEE